MSDHISSLRLSVQGPFQSQSASPGLDSLVQGDSVVFRELQFRHTCPATYSVSLRIFSSLF